MVDVLRSQILLVDDHPLFRNGLAMVLAVEPDLQVIGEASTADEAVRYAREEIIDLAVTDVLMPTTTGISLASHLIEVNPRLKILGLSVLEEPVEWAAVDGAPVQILFTVLRPERPGRDHDPEKHLEMMRGIAKLAREPDFRRFALRARTRTELVGLLKEMAAV